MLLSESNNNNHFNGNKFALWINNRYSSHYRNGFILYLIFNIIILFVDYNSLRNKFLDILLMKFFLSFLPLILVIFLTKSTIYKSKFLLINSFANLLPTFATILMYLYFLEYYNSLASIYFSILVVQIFLFSFFSYKWVITLVDSLIVILFFSIVHLLIYTDTTFFNIPYLPFLILVSLVTSLISYYYQEIKEKMYKADIELSKEKYKIIAQNKNLKELNDLKNVLFSVIGHDLRSPVGGIRNLLRVMNEEFDSFSKDELKEYIQTLYKSSRNIYQLLENLLTWGKVINENFMVNLEKMSIYQLLKDVVEITQLQVNEKNIEIIFETQDDFIIETDIFILSTVIRNLISNAVKFTPNKGKIIIRFSEGDENYKIEIEDNGIGMDEKLLSRIFEIDKNKVRNGTNQEQGTGLGLLIVRDFLKKVDGYLVFKSNPGEGTKVTIYLPKN